MDRALWLLLKLRLKGWLRRLLRGLNTVKGLLVAILGGMAIAAWLLSVVVFAPAPTEHHLGVVRDLGPLVLLLFCLLNYFLAAGERVLAFSPAEVNFLFPAPFSRRQLLLYKIAALSAGAVLLGLFMGLILRQHATGYVTALVGSTLSILFLQYFALVTALLVSIVGARAYNRQRRIMLGVLIVAVAALFVWQGAGRFDRPFAEVAGELRQNRVVEFVLAPFIWQINTLTAENLWPDLVQGAALSLVASLVLLGIILVLDVHYLESAAAASEKIYRRLERLRRGGVAAAGMRMSEKARWSLPSLPRWGGVGPLIWRQLLGSLRQFWWTVPVGIFMVSFLTPMFFLTGKEETGEREAVVIVLGTMLIFLGLFLPALMTFDFRADVDRMEVLKTLPLPAWKIVLGQLLVPVVLVTAVQMAMLIAMQIALQEFQPVLCALPSFLAAMNFLIFAVENLFFLWFPTRQLAATPGDIQNFGRVLVLWMVKLFLLMIVALVATLLAVAAFFVAGQSYVAAGVVAWLVVTGCAVAAVPLLCLAFNRFDVSQDTPP